MDINKSTKPRRYAVDLARLHRVWSANYAALLAWLPALRQLPVGSVSEGCTGRREIDVVIVERGPHTVIIDIRHSDGGDRLTDGHFRLRVYHDARMAEVVATEGHRFLRPRYSYPNARMYQPDEKLRVNCHFSEWLKYRLKHDCPAPASASLSRSDQQ